MIAPEIIQNLPDFSDFREGEIRTLAALAEEEWHEAGEFIFREGDQACAIYLMLHGQVEIMVNINAEGTQRAAVMTVKPGEIFGWPSLVEPNRQTTSARCITPVSVAAIPARYLQALAGVYCTLRFRLLEKSCQVASARLRVTRAQLLNALGGSHLEGH